MGEGNFKIPTWQVSSLCRHCTEDFKATAAITLSSATCNTSQRKLHPGNLISTLDSVTGIFPPGGLL